MTIRFRLLESDGVTERYTFPFVQYTNLPQSLEKFTEIQGIRGIGSIIIEGSESSWDLIIRGKIRGTDYEDITDQIDELESKLVFAQPYYIKVDKVEGGATTYTYKVRRLQPIEYSESLRNGRGLQEYTVTLKVNSW